MKQTKKEKILESALELFGNSGYNATSTKKIATDAGVSEGLIFSHFTNKEGLLNALLKNAEQKVIAVMEPILAEKNPKQVLKKSVESLFEYSDAEYHFWKLMFKLKWEINYSHSEQFLPLLKKLTESFEELGYKNPAMEAQLFLQIVEGILAEIMRGNKKEQEKVKDFLLEKYKI